MFPTAEKLGSILSLSEVDYLDLQSFFSRSLRGSMIQLHLLRSESMLHVSLF